MYPLILDELRKQNALLEALPGRIAEVIQASIGATTAETLRALDRRRKRRSPGVPALTPGPTAEKDTHE
jgi:hypothetical protein